MTIFRIECFLAVAEHLNFARAATQLNVSQPAITRQIHTLEAELGTQLFIRSTRMVRLTENGRIFQSDAQLIVHTARRSVQRFASQDESKIIDFHIGCANPLHMELLSNTLEQRHLSNAPPKGSHSSGNTFSRCPKKGSFGRCCGIPRSRCQRFSSL